jgi:hypothetical protein
VSSISRAWFTVVFCVAYVPILVFDWPIFVYYPQGMHIHLRERATEAGPAMHWYGLVASAAIAGGITSLLCRLSWLPKRVVPWLWVAPVATMLAIVIYLRQYFR